MRERKIAKAPETPKAADDGTEKAPIVIKKYANRRLYNTATSSYVTLDYLREMVKEGDNFVVFDAKSGDDITRTVLAQIIFEQESKGENLLPINFLRQLIRFYDDTLQAALPKYLDMSMDRFTRDQEKMREYLVNTFTPKPPLARFEDMARQNIALFERMFNMFSPFSAQAEGGEQPAPEPARESPDESLAQVKAQLDALQKQLEQISKK
ncbi:polyhydroxyalkanoate synthesis repressor PhaR [Emcibacter sp. SYSU 3D8]|uniref:polyhydroxyalkanoate synthesis repressor PhaR n=1 Tax=Emcibacter sp. SYSU 3D8 TaxID=3133969 RepID=UPI0031FF179C